MQKATKKSAAFGALVLFVCLLMISVWRTRERFSLGRTREIHAGTDGLPYRVHLAHRDPARAANTMAELNRRAIRLLRRLRQSYRRNLFRKIAFPERAHATARLLSLYNPDNLAENSPRDPGGDTSYTLDKGAVLALCLREKNSARPGFHDIHDLETLTFVTLHELSHIATEDIDHPPRFWRTFRFILEEAVQAGILRGADYGRYPTVYCGIGIDYNPLFDPDLEPIT